MDSSLAVTGKSYRPAKVRRFNIFRRGQSLDDNSGHRFQETMPPLGLRPLTRPEVPNEPGPSSFATMCRVGVTSRSAETIIETNGSRAQVNPDYREFKAADKTFENKSDNPRISLEVLPTATFPEASRRDILFEQLQRNVYECIVCFEKVLPIEPIWTCRKCFTIFHLTCITKWAISSTTENDEIYGESDETQLTTWRCPSCQVRTLNIPERSWCFCSKVVDPETVVSESHFGQCLPHSCGQICGRTSLCKHACSIPCHPGDCPACLILATRFCCCGKVAVKAICSSKTVLTCDNICQKLLSCGIHRCSQGCHYKPCPKCEFSIMLECHCGKESKEVPCSILKIHQTKYSCGKPCEKSNDFKCRNCCHPGKCSGVQGGYWRRARIIRTEEDRAGKEIAIVLIIFLIMLIFCFALYLLFESLKTK